MFVIYYNRCDQYEKLMIRPRDCGGQRLIKTLAKYQLEISKCKLLRIPKKANKKSNISPELAKYCLKPRKTNTSKKA